ncbi:hypothetical protein JKG47_08810 [Acidithiobacillus sp. MC6.1]|nr:hypothetical protein [Acidithiobacillus sp. MC6.1]
MINTFGADALVILVLAVDKRENLVALQRRRLLDNFWTLRLCMGVYGDGWACTKRQ